jgi:type II secretory pathway pseudopilin PulG
MNSAISPFVSADPHRVSGKKGFTLVETMVATVLLSMIIISILAVLIGSYRVAAKARYNDHARYVVKSLADQFLTQQTIDSTTGLTFTLFVPNGTSPDGSGMTWTNYDGSLGSQTGQGMQVLLGGDTGASIPAYVTRSVWYLYAGGGNAGQTTMAPQNGSAGFLLRGDFTIQYTFPPGSSQAANYTQTVSVVRSCP